MAQGKGRLTKLESERLRGEFIDWYILDKATRRSFGMPTSYEEFAELKGTTTRTLRRWRDDPDFHRKVGQRRTALAAHNGANARVSNYGPPAEGKPERLDPVHPGSHPDLDPAIDDPGRRDYELFRAQLRDRALSGESEKAAELWLRHFAQPYIEEDRAQRESSFTDLSDADLIDRTLNLIGVDAVREWLAARG